MVQKKVSVDSVKEDEPSSRMPPSHKKPRRIKSVSDALNLLGTSVQHIIEKRLHRTSSHESDTFFQLQKEFPATADKGGITFEAKALPNITEFNGDSPGENCGDEIKSGRIPITLEPTTIPTITVFNGDNPVENCGDEMERRSRESSPDSRESTPSVPKRRHSHKVKSNGPKISFKWVESATAEPGLAEDVPSANAHSESPLNDKNHHKKPILHTDIDHSKIIRKGISFLNDTDDDNVSDSSKESSHQYSRKNSVAPHKAYGLGRNHRTVEPQDPHQIHRNVDDLLFDMFQEKDEEAVLVGNFLGALERSGLRRSDPRLSELFENLMQVHKDQLSLFPKGGIGSVETLRLNRPDFKKVIADNIVLISRAFRKQFVIPEFPLFCQHIQDIYVKCNKITGGKNASYIPQLARVNSNYWGVSICTIDGQRHSIGDTVVPFTLQSCSKPLTYAIALNELGEETVHQYVGQEPSGRMFNELVLDYNKKPHNPMVNAGAIIVISLLKSMVRPEMTLAEKFDYTLQYFKRLGGGEYLGFNNAVFLSEREAADRNYALGFYMREHKCFPEGTNLKECMDYYFQVCSMETNCEATAVMAATLANGGICPVSGEKVLKSDSVRDVLSLMHSCGMYDYSGQFAFKVGLPAKSGVSGCIILVVPNVLGMCIYSPPLDSLGNSVRGVTFCQELVEVFNFHKYDNLRHASHKIDPRRHRYETKGLNIVNLLFAAASGDVTSMRRLHLSGMDMSAMDYDGRSAVHLASAEGHLECVEYLLRHCRVSHKPRDRWGHLPLDDAERFGHDDVVDFLRQWESEHGGGSIEGGSESG